jgi:hypothetical protein
MADGATKPPSSDSLKISPAAPAGGPAEADGPGAGDPDPSGDADGPPDGEPSGAAAEQAPTRSAAAATRKTMRWDAIPLVDLR